MLLPARIFLFTPAFLLLLSLPAFIWMLRKY